MSTATHILVTGARRGIGKAAAAALDTPLTKLACHATQTGDHVAIPDAIT